jgi:hypothetical protein
MATLETDKASQRARIIESITRAAQTNKTLFGATSANMRIRPGTTMDDAKVRLKLDASLPISSEYSRVAGKKNYET